MAKSTDFGLGGILARPGQGRGVDPQQAADRSPTAQEALQAVQRAAEAGQAGAGEPEPQEHLPVPQPPREVATVPKRGAGSLLNGMKPRDSVPMANDQVRLPETISRKLKLMAVMEDTSKQQIMEDAITAVVLEWEDRVMGGGSESRESD